MNRGGAAPHGLWELLFYEKGESEMSLDSLVMSINNILVLVSAFLVFLMQAGFCLVEAGLTRAKNAGNIVMKNLMDFAIGSLVFAAVGFAIMFGRDVAGLFGNSGFFLSDGFAHLGLEIPLLTFVLFQTVFAGTAATIVSGTMSERTKFLSYCLYSAVICMIIYPVVGHWAWGGGWLSQLGFIDFAGSTVVHSVGGWTALLGAWLVGPRLGKYTTDGKVNTIPGHNPVMTALGVFILWFGWFGFNTGSALSGTSASLGHIAVTTNLSAAAGATAAMFYSWLVYKKPLVPITLNGALGGLVAITAGTASVGPGAAVAIGIMAGVLVSASCDFIDRVLKIDDPVGAISVHGVCGAFGTVMVGVFATEGGLLYGGGTELLVTQLAGVAATFIWTVVTSILLFSVIKAAVGLRVRPEDELSGLDVSEHGLPAPSYEPAVNRVLREELSVSPEV